MSGKDFFAEGKFSEVNFSEIKKNYKLSEKEYKKILETLGRIPNHAELGIFSAMWSEHCSYKTTKKFLKNLYTQNKDVICGPGENAGVVDIGGNEALVFKMESHNHPSQVEPFQGASTGVGGIMRDVFTMGARPIALADCLYFSSNKQPDFLHLFSGVIEGIGSYGNCTGIPNIYGKYSFNDCYKNNVIVNAMCVGLAQKDKIFYSAASKIGASVLYIGAKTGRDGVGGARMSSGNFESGEQKLRPKVQIGDPFSGKKLIEACQELMETGAVLAVQDMGAAGLTSSSVEMAAKGGNVGIEIDLDLVPQREPDMDAYELMLSESQERMLVILQEGSEDIAHKILEKWDLDCTKIGIITDNIGRIVVKHHAHVAVDLPLDLLTEGVPSNDFEYTPHEKMAVASADALQIQEFEDKEDLAQHIEESVLYMLTQFEFAGKGWVRSQYDQSVGGKIYQKNRSENFDAGIILLNDGTKRAIALTLACNSSYVKSNAFLGTKIAVAESYRNISAVGGRALAITNCLNFADPSNPQTMSELVAAIAGIADSCRALDYPVVSGNVSLYNATDGKGIFPTPSIGAVGLIDDYDLIPAEMFTEAGEDIVLIGTNKGHLEGTSYAEYVCDEMLGALPDLDLALEKRTSQFILQQLAKKRLSAVRSIKNGGMLMTLLQMSITSGIAFDLNLNHFGEDSGLSELALLFGENQGMYIVTAKEAVDLIQEAKDVGLDALIIGKTTAGESLNIDLFAKAQPVKASWYLEDLEDCFYQQIDLFLKSNR